MCAKIIDVYSWRNFTHPARRKPKSRFGRLLLDYIVVHELAHLTERNHGPRFWALVDSVLPDVGARKRSLKAVEGTLPL